MKKMTIAALVVLIPAILVSCKAQSEGKEFEKEFEAAKKASGLKEAPVVKGGTGKDLQTNVQRIGDPLPPTGVEESDELPPTLTTQTIARVVRHRVSRLRFCLMSENARQKAGKAVITFTILPSGRVSSVSVNAPAFEGTEVAQCVQRSASLWTFPKFAEGKITHSYPVIFRGQ